MSLFSILAVSIFGARWTLTDSVLNNLRLTAALNFAHYKIIENFERPPGALEPSIEQTAIAGLWAWGIRALPFGEPFTHCESLLGYDLAWRNSWGNFATTTFNFLASDPDAVRKYGKDCGGQPKPFSDAEFDLAGTIDLGSQATDVDIFRKQAFVSLIPSAGLAVVSTESPFEKVFVGAGYGINKIDVLEGYVFAANNSSTSQLLVFRNENSTGPPQGAALIATSTLPNVTGSRPEAVSIAYYDSRVYVGTKRTAGHEFHIFDVSNPANPVWLGSREVNHNINDIAVKNGLAFLATSGNIRDLIVLDVRDPAHIVQMLAIDLPGNEDGCSVYVSGNTVFLGRYRGTVPGHDELWALRFNFDTAGNTLHVETLATAPAGADITSLTNAGGYLFASTRNAQKEFQIFNAGRASGTDVAPIQRLLSLSERNLAEQATGVDAQDEIIAVSAGNTLSIFRQR